MSTLYAIVRIRGSVNATRGIDSTLEMLKLKKVNNCMVYPKTPVIDGMLKKAGTYLTWGEVTQETIKKLLSKRGLKKGDKKLEEKEIDEVIQNLMKENKLKEKIKLPFRLSPPSKGFSSVKQRYPEGDAGYRGDKINELLEKMI